MCPDDTKPLDITACDWLSDLDRLRVVIDPRAHVFTAEQDAAIRRARGVDPPVPWARLVDFFAARGWNGSENTLRKRWRELKSHI